MTSVPIADPFANELGISQLRLLSPRADKSSEMKLVKVKKPHHLSSTDLHFFKKKPEDIMHENYKKIIKQRYPTIQLSLGTIDFNGKGSITKEDLLEYYK